MSTLTSALVAAGVAAPAATATFSPGATPASAFGSLVGDDQSAAPLISADGRYVVFQTAASVLMGPGSTGDVRPSAGLVRKDLVTGAVDLVAPPREIRRADGTTSNAGTTSGLAGISADGRYVLFGSPARLAAGDAAPSTPDVYVRDMDRPMAGGGAFALVSARDGSDLGAQYAADDQGSVPGAAGYALSADGRRAVFVTTVVSDLPDRLAITTPQRQVWVRDLDARTTRLVSRRADDASQAGVPAPAPTAIGATVPTAAISGDGRKVVWTAGDGQLQTPTLPGEAPFGPQPTLLWRDLSAAPQAPSRRVAGAIDLDDPACAPGTPAPGPDDGGSCAGPFRTSEGVDFNGDVSSLAFEGLSADGSSVLFASSATRRPFDPLAYRPSTSYVADMRSGLARKQGVQVAWSYPAVKNRGAMLGGRLAADGRHATFTSTDNRFDGLQPIGTFPTGNLLTFNVYVADLAARTVERVTSGDDGGDYVTASQPSTPTGIAVPSADASSVAFPAPDGNLFVGDANGVDDVLVARTLVSSAGRGDRVLPLAAPPVPVDPTPITPLKPRFFTTVGRVTVSRRTGTATVSVKVPAKGTLTASARGTQKRKVGRKVRSTSVTVGSARRTPARAGTVRVTVKVGAKARTALRRRPYLLDVRMTLRFRPTGAAATTATRAYRLKRSYVARTAAKGRTR
ncbi:hypothetical protein [Patulibacter minatonensis]|uniref:hypothetical protein n=1 Tax=Patulibacter minatonensis TaxID=298163 RepID=UPI000478DF8E|nr:hypothetical protein [Patulibacter minatonensis]